MHACPVPLMTMSGTLDCLARVWGPAQHSRPYRTIWRDCHSTVPVPPATKQLPCTTCPAAPRVICFACIPGTALKPNLCSCVPVFAFRGTLVRCGVQAGGAARSAWNEADRGAADPVAEASRAFTSSLIAVKHDADAGAAAPGAGDAAAGGNGSAGGQAGDHMQGAQWVMEGAAQAAAAGGSGEEGPTILGAGAAVGTLPAGGSPGLAAAGAGAPTPPAAGAPTAAAGAAAAVAAAMGVVGVSPPASPDRVGVALVGALGSPKQHLANGPLLPNGALHGSSPGRSTSPGSPARHTPTSTHTARASPTRGSPGGTPHPPSPMEEDHWPDTPMVPRGTHMHGAVAHMHNPLSGAPASPVHMHNSLSGAPASPVHGLAAAVGSQPHPPGSPGAGGMPGSPKALAHGPHSLLAMAQGAHTTPHAPMPTQLQQPQPVSPVHAPAAAHQHGLLLPTAPDAPASGSADAGAGRGDGEGAQQPAALTAPQPPPPAPS